MSIQVGEGRTLPSREAAEKSPIIQRLARIEGQVRGLRQMAETNRPTLEQVQQVNAVVAALREVALLSISQELKGQLAVMATTPNSAGDLRGFVELLRASFRLSLDGT